MAETTGGSVRNARIFVSAPQAVAVTMHGRGRDELREGFEALERGEQHLGAAVDVRFREAEGTDRKPKGVLVAIAEAGR